MSAPELKPCPFCGGEAHMYQTSQDSDTQVQAQCKGCGAEMSFWLPWTAGAGERVSAWIDVGRRWNTRADLAPAAPKVKALVWQDFDGQGAKASGFYQANYLITLWRGQGKFEVSMSYPGYQTGFDGERWHDTIEAAKAAAQADYEARILAALEGGDA